MSKVLLEVKGTTLDGSTKSFNEPVFQTIGMFVAMMLALAFRYLKRTFFVQRAPTARQKGYDAIADGSYTAADKPLSWGLFFLMALPSTFDLLATYLCTFGLEYVSVSVYQILRGGASIAITSLLKHFFIPGGALKSHQWAGVIISVLSIMLCAQSAGCSTGSAKDDDDESASNAAALATWGVVLILLGGTVQAMQYVFEERVMGEDMISDDVGDPAYLVVGLEGFWGTVLCVCVLYPITYMLPGDDNGSLESPLNAWHMVMSSEDIRSTLFWYVSFIFAYNLLAIMVTKQLDSVWHSILDLFRPGTVWGFDLFLYYAVARGENVSYGEQWINGCSTWQLYGFIMLLVATAVYAEIMPLPGFLSSSSSSSSSKYSLQKSPGRSPFLSRQARREDAAEEGKALVLQYQSQNNARQRSNSGTV